MGLCMSRMSQVPGTCLNCNAIQIHTHSAPLLSTMPWPVFRPRCGGRHAGNLLGNSVLAATTLHAMRAQHELNAEQMENTSRRSAVEHHTELRQIPQMLCLPNHDVRGCSLGGCTTAQLRGVRRCGTVLQCLMERWVGVFAS